MFCRHGSDEDDDTEDEDDDGEDEIGEDGTRLLFTARARQFLLQSWEFKVDFFQDVFLWCALSLRRCLFPSPDFLCARVHPEVIKGF